MKKQSAGILLYRKTGRDIEVMLVHPGGPFWAKRDNGAWSFPKGEFEDGEEPIEAVKREFVEELAQPVPDGELIPLGETKLSSGKIIHAWALEADFDASNIKSNAFTMEWPPKSGRQQEFPEVDQAAWFYITVATSKLTPGQKPILLTLASNLGIAMEGRTEPLSKVQITLFQIFKIIPR